MTKQEKDYIFDEFEKSLISPEDGMTLEEMKAYLKGYEDAKYRLYDSVDKCYRAMKTD